jgi:co-chaperonin GroES (HSP10)
MEHYISIVDQLGGIDDVEIFNNQLLVAIYIRPKDAKSAGGIILTDNNKDEDRYQSKIGVILKMGPQAFKDPEQRWFAGAEFKVGDLVMFRASDGLNLELTKIGQRLTSEKVLCKILEDTSVRMRVKTASRVW